MNQDRRARLTVKGSYSAPMNGPGAPLNQTGRGFIFPFTPNITTQNGVEYNQYATVHTNYQQNAYSKTRTPTLQVTGQFVNQTEDEAKYTAGVMHFLRVVSKSDFGSDETAGAPPPVLQFSAYGQFNRVPVLLTNFTFTFPDDQDYIEIEVPGQGIIHLPVMVTIAIDLLPQYSAQKQRQFSVREFSQGNLYRSGFL
jgi:hypothetical protein